MQEKLPMVEMFMLTMSAGRDRVLSVDRWSAEMR